VIIVTAVLSAGPVPLRTPEIKFPGILDIGKTAALIDPGAVSKAQTDIEQAGKIQSG
jgi:hypothetical protein